MIGLHPFRSVPWRYLRKLLAEIGGLLALLLLAVEALYLADKTITHLLLDALNNQLGLGFLLETLALAVPEILGIGLPLAVVIAVYLALLRRREAGDLVVLSAAGLSPVLLPVLCLGLGLPVIMASGALSGFVEPLAAHKLRERLLEGQYEALRSGELLPGQFRELGTSTYYRRPAAEGAGEALADIFVHDQPGPDREQTITATGLQLQFDAVTGVAGLNLTNPRIIGFVQNDEGQHVPSQRVDTAAMTFGPVMLERVAAGPRHQSTDTMTLPELISAWQAGENPAGQVATERMISVALAFLAPFFAGLALVVSRGRMVWLALPLALGAVLAGGLARATLAGAIVPLGLWGAVSLLGGGVALLALVFGVVMARGLPGSIAPMRRSM